MNPLEKYDLDELLAPPAPEPPERLLSEIQSEIPEPLEELPELPESPPATAWKRHRWLIAATVLSAVGASFLTLRLERSQPAPAAESALSRAKVLKEAMVLEEALRGGVPETEGVLDEAASKQNTPSPDAVARDETLLQRENLPAASPTPAGVRAGREADGRLLERLRKVAPKDQRVEGTTPRSLNEEKAAGRDALRQAAPAPGVSSPEPVAEENALRLSATRSQAPPPPRPPASPVRVAPGEARAKKVPIPDPTPDELKASANQGRVYAEMKLEIPKPTQETEFTEMIIAEPTPSTGGDSEPNDEPYGDVFYRDYGVNPFIDTEDDRLSTFGLDVDTASFTLARRYLRDGNLPPREALRVEEMINYFDYGDPPPEEGDFALHAEGAPSPFGEGERYYLLRLGIRGRDIDTRDRRPADLTFVVDTSGSMNRENRIGLVKEALGLLLDQLRDDDRIALVTYGSSGRVVLRPTADREAIRRALEALRPGGSTNAEEGLTLAYKLAAAHRREGAIHRVVLCSDGVANVGATGPESILERIRTFARQGVELTTVGFGMGNYNDVLMEQLADQGNGRYAYVDNLEEARRIFVENLTGTLQTLAAEARSQVEFDPELVSRYRLLGYENRDIADERFRDDTVDAGEIGVGHTVTALYELKLERKPRKRDRLATLRLRYGAIDRGEVVELERPITGADFAPSWRRASAALRLASLVAEWAELLKGSYWAREGDPEEVFRLAQAVSAEFPGDVDVADFVSLAGRTARLRPNDSRR